MDLDWPSAARIALKRSVSQSVSVCVCVCVLVVVLMCLELSYIYIYNIIVLHLSLESRSLSQLFPESCTTVYFEYQPVVPKSDVLVSPSPLPLPLPPPPSPCLDSWLSLFLAGRGGKAQCWN